MSGIGQMSERDLWGLTPNAPPMPAQEQAQTVPTPVQAPATPPPTQVPAQAPAPKPAPPVAFDPNLPPQVPETARWGTEPAPEAVGQIDERTELDTNKREEAEAYAGTVLSMTGEHHAVIKRFTPQEHPEYGKWQEGMQILSQTRDRNVRAQYKPMVDALGRKIQAEVRARDQEITRQRQEGMKKAEAPYQSLEARAKTDEVVTSALGTVITDNLAGVQSKNPPDARQADYDLNVSPLMTLSKPKPGTNPDEKPNGTNRDYRPLRDAIATVAVNNGGLSPDAAVNYTLRIGTPGGGTDEKGNQLKGFNGHYGAGAANYKVLGRDEMDRVLIQMYDGQKLKIPAATYKQLLTAREQGANRAKKWEEAYKKSQEPGLVSRVLKSVIPEKGF